LLFWQFAKSAMVHRAFTKNKSGGTADIREHRASPFVVGWAMQTLEEIIHV
jgi:hypothetical protein